MEWKLIEIELLAKERGENLKQTLQYCYQNNIKVYYEYANDTMWIQREQLPANECGLQ